MDSDPFSGCCRSGRGAAAHRSPQPVQRLPGWESSCPAPSHLGPSLSWPAPLPCYYGAPSISDCWSTAPKPLGGASIYSSRVCLERLLGVGHPAPCEQGGQGLGSPLFCLMEMTALHPARPPRQLHFARSRSARPCWQVGLGASVQVPGQGVGGGGARPRPAGLAPPLSPWLRPTLASPLLAPSPRLRSTAPRPAGAR